MGNKQNYLIYGFRQFPEVIAVSRAFSHSEKIIISKVFDMMWMNKDTKDYAGSAFMSNQYLMDWCDVSERTVLRCKNKVIDMGLFTIRKRFNKTDIWTLNEIPQFIVDEFEDFLEEQKRKKQMNNMTNTDIINITADMTKEECDQFFINNPELGVKVT